jgi:hypothetical protein
MHVVEFPGNALALPRSSLVRFWVAALCWPRRSGASVEAVSRREIAPPLRNVLTEV